MRLEILFLKQWRVCAPLNSSPSIIETHRYAHIRKLTLALAAVWQEPPVEGACAPHLYSTTTNGNQMCVWGTAVIGVTIDRRQSSPHSNSSAVPSNLPQFQRPLHTCSHTLPHTHTHVDTHLDLSPAAQSFLVTSSLRLCVHEVLFQRWGLSQTFVECSSLTCHCSFLSMWNNTITILWLEMETGTNKGAIV